MMATLEFGRSGGDNGTITLDFVAALDLAAEETQWTGRTKAEAEAALEAAGFFQITRETALAARALDNLWYHPSGLTACVTIYPLFVPSAYSSPYRSVPHVSESIAFGVSIGRTSWDRAAAERVLAAVAAR